MNCVQRDVSEEGAPRETGGQNETFEIVIQKERILSGYRPWPGDDGPVFSGAGPVVDAARVRPVVSVLTGNLWEAAAVEGESRSGAASAEPVPEPAEVRRRGLVAGEVSEMPLAENSRAIPVGL